MSYTTTLGIRHKPQALVQESFFFSYMGAYLQSVNTMTQKAHALTFFKIKGALN